MFFEESVRYPLNFGFIQLKQKMACCRRLSNRLKLAQLIGFCFFVSACGPDGNVVEVQERIGVNATRSLEPIQVEIYEYVDQMYQDTDYTVTDAPPLRFSFPAAYYGNTPSIKGGPVGRMDLTFDRDTWRPYSTAFPRRFRGDPPISKSEKRSRDLRSLRVSVYANILQSGWLPGKSLLMLRKYQQPFEEIGSFEGFQLYSYQTSNDAVNKPHKPLLLGGIDFNGHNTIVGISEVDGSEDQRFICSKFGGCGYYFIYEGRHVQMRINKIDLSNAREFERKIIEILDRHRVE